MIEPNKLFISSLSLVNFRNYTDLKLATSAAPVVLTGENGAGKTNILEAISLLVPGKGVSVAGITEFQQNGTEYIKNPWAVIGKVNIGEEENVVATSLEFNASFKPKRLIKVNSEKIKIQSELNSYISILHAVPKMDHVFNSGSKIRREFLDNLTAVFDLSHSENLKIYDKFSRERRKLLYNHERNSNWLDSVEKTMAEAAVIIATARKQAVEHIAKFLNKSDNVFPQAEIRAVGFVENLLDDRPALQAEAAYADKLREKRELDFVSGMTHYGPHRSDLEVIYTKKQVLAENSSTGEQKSLLISIILAASLARAEWYGFPPILLLDDFFAHLDEKVRDNLLKEIIDLGLQAWITSTERDFFRKFAEKMQFFTVKNSTIC